MHKFCVTDTDRDKQTERERRRERERGRGERAGRPANALIQFKADSE